MSLSVAIPTYGRGPVLINTLHYLCELDTRPSEIIVIDQTEKHEDSIEDELKRLNDTGTINWIRLGIASITRAMNVGLRKAKNERVLFLDDDIIPGKDLIKAHLETGEMLENVIVAGRVLQPWHKGKPDLNENKFLFNSLHSRSVETFMGGNVSIPRTLGLEIGGFDTNFVKVAYHFEAEFAYRWRSAGGHIYYEANALIHHLKTERGGTRTYGNHLKTVEPDHAVGRYYYYFCTKTVKDALKESLYSMFKSVRTKHHIRKPYWIPLTLLAELRGFVWSVVLYQSGRGLVSEKIRLLIVASHPIQYMTPIYKKLSEEPISSEVLYLSLPDKESQSLGFGKPFEWDVPLLEGYRYTVSKSAAGKGLHRGFFGVRVRNPWLDLKALCKENKPDVVLITGWHFFGMVQLFCAAKLFNIPIIIRMDSNNLKRRNYVVNLIYKNFVSFATRGLTVGHENQQFLISLGMNRQKIIPSPHVVDNDYFSLKAGEHRVSVKEIRRRMGLPVDSFCFVFVGKLQEMKRPLDIISAFRAAYNILGSKISLLMVGTGRLERICRDSASENKLPIIFTGFLNQSEIPVAYAIADCIVLASDADETWGLVINEAMACSLPAIVSCLVGSGKDLVRDGLTGYRYACGDIDQLSKTMVKMASNPVSSQQMGRNAKKLVEEEYSLDAVVNGIIRAVSDIAG